MVSAGRRLFSTTTPHFFGIILEETARDLKLKVPKKFMIKYGGDLQTSVRLKLPSGAEREVGLTRCNGKVWFEKGWPEFSRFCSLDYGNFLLFRYAGESIFEVCIFDRTTTEIDYPITQLTIEEEEEEEEEDQSDDISIEISEDLPHCKKMKTNSSTKADMISENEKAQNHDVVLFEKPMANNDSHCSISEKKGEGDFLAQKDTSGGASCYPRFLKQTPNCEVNEKSVSFRRPNALRPGEQPSFKISMNPCAIHESILSLPSEFTDRYLIKLPAGIATLQVSGSRSVWSAKFKYDHQKSKALLLNGWSTFVRDNDLKVGDVCIFILIDPLDLLFEVVLPAIEAPSLLMAPGYCRGAIIQVKEQRSHMNCEIGVSSSLEIVNKMSKSLPLEIRRSKSL